MVGNIICHPLTDGEEYSYLVHAIIDQMLSIKVGAKIYGRLESLCSGRISPENIASLTTEEIRSTGISNDKAEYIQIITDAVLSGDLNISELFAISDDAVIKN
jgi:hhH-GPD superfamily base excision DNA repair protein